MARRVMIICLLSCALPLFAQQTLDRTKMTPAGPPTPLHVPTWTMSTLPNGAAFAVSESHALPIVSVQITFMGGADQYERADRHGVSGLATAMMSEGTKTRDADALSTAQQMLGTAIAVGVGNETGTISFTSTTANFDKALDLMSDVMLNSTFPASALERLRQQRLANLTAAKAQPASIASRVFSRLLYGDNHPLGQATTESSIKAITRDDVVAFRDGYFQPGRALITVVGDVTAASAKAAVEKTLASWPKGGDRPTFAYPALPEKKPTTIYLVDKPGAAQSTVAIGLPGPARSTADYFAILVMNQILGSGSNFMSRINANIREDKGYSYGVSSSFGFGKGPGAFRAGGDIVSAHTDGAMVEFMKELRGIQGDRPITDDELKTAKDSLIQRLPGTFASVQAIGATISSMWTQGLPADFYQTYAGHVASVTKDDVLRVAKQYVDLGHLTIVIVGDRATIEAPLKATNIGPIVMTDGEGNPNAGK